MSENKTNGQIQIADEVVGVIATTAALEVEGVVAGGGKGFVELFGKKGHTILWYPYIAIIFPPDLALWQLIFYDDSVSLSSIVQAQSLLCAWTELALKNLLLQW